MKHALGLSLVMALVACSKPGTPFSVTATAELRDRIVILEDGNTSLAVVGLCVGLVRGAVEVDLLWSLAG